ncbi:NAD(P)-binding protein [Aulographum hederae CBS 113979]|uniref:NAD(P)-binding protein n=1 Tax=Aulographum hederae CBS 113979 TaxID=1176131 RepID=A0A6G1GTA8_9PEZI|nr:NAD(P)-binding protein [Aulographum hederae CBS 113979]
MMRIAVCGTNGLALLIAHFLQEQTNHQLVILSRSRQPTLESEGYQTLLVDYENDLSLLHALSGINTVISTVTGPPQIALIHAAAQTRVRRFAAAEFEGSPSRRSNPDPLDNGKAAALAWLEQYRVQNGMQYTSFVCGILYERFAPGGLRAYGLGLNSAACEEGDFLMNLREMSVNAPYWSAQGTQTTVCLTAMQDVARCVVKAVEMPGTWDRRMQVFGERVTVGELVGIVQEVLGRQFHSIQWPDITMLRAEVSAAQAEGDIERQMRAHYHMAAAEGRYEFTRRNLLERFPDVAVLRFREWLVNTWATIQ